MYFYHMYSTSDKFFLTCAKTSSINVNVNVKLSTCFLIVDIWYGLTLCKIEGQVLS